VTSVFFRWFMWYWFRTKSTENRASVWCTRLITKLLSNIC